MRTRCASWMMMLGVVSLAATPVAWAAPITKVVAFGDSLSDSGNVFAATGGTYPPPPYAQRFSNGPVAVEYLAQALGVPLDNRAFGGATTGRAFPVGAVGTEPNYINASTPAFPVPLPNIGDQFAEYIGTTPVDPMALYVIWGGSNDIFLGALTGEIFTSPGAVVGRAVTNLATMVGTLLSGGAQNILVPGVPNLGAAPAFNGNEAAATAIASSFNTSLLGALMTNLPLGGWTYFDTFAALNEAIANPAAFGFVNVTDPCVIPPSTGFPGFVCGSNVGEQNTFLYWDTAHPTTAAHEFLADQWVETVVPEPATLLLLGSGLALGGYVRRRARRA